MRQLKYEETTSSPHCTVTTYILSRCVACQLHVHPRTGSIPLRQRDSYTYPSNGNSDSYSYSYEYPYGRHTDCYAVSYPYTRVTHGYPYFYRNSSLYAALARQGGRRYLLSNTNRGVLR